MPQAGGASNVLELHGSLWNVKCVGTSSTAPRAGVVWENRDQPLVPSLASCSDDAKEATSVSVDDLPHSKDGKLLRPAVVWFGEGLEKEVFDAAKAATTACSVLVVVGTSGTVAPAPSLIEAAVKRGVSLVEVNAEPSAYTRAADYVFTGPSELVLPKLLLS